MVCCFTLCTAIAMCVLLNNLCIGFFHTLVTWTCFHGLVSPGYRQRHRRTRTSILRALIQRAFMYILNAFHRFLVFNCIRLLVYCLRLLVQQPCAWFLPNFAPQGRICPFCKRSMPFSRHLRKFFKISQNLDN